MPAYFFHLAFEIQHRNECQFVPKPDLDVFSDALPAHHTSSWASYIAPRGHRSFSQQHTIHKGRRDRDASSPTSTHIDWRTGDIAIEGIDMQAASDQEQIAPHSPTKTTEGQVAATGLATRGRYVPSDPQSTELGQGVVHLYRDRHPANYSNFDQIKQTSADNDDSQHAYVDNDCTTLCVLAVPSYMTPSDLLGWFGEDTRDQVTHFRLVRTERSNRYMVLMKFRQSQQAKEWQKAWNGKLFNVMEPENCHVVFVKSIQFQSRDNTKDSSSYPEVLNDPFTPAVRKPTDSETTKQSTEQPSSKTSTLSVKPAPPHLELPTCPVCLERMDDEVTGLATIFCQHVFHCACLQKWRGSGCPVCRYTQEEQTAKNGATGCTESECNTCGATENLWICLICGHVGCGRYDEAHAFAHFEHTGHGFAMDISSQHIWDYVGDEWVHRLVQNKTDGKLVELPFSMKSDKLAADDEDSSFDKMDSVGMEYTQLLQSQLDSQRTYFEEQIGRAVDKAAAAGVAAEQAANQAVKAWSRLETLEATNTTATQDTIPSLEKDRDRAERKAAKLESTTRQLQREWSESKVINESLMDRIAHLEKQLDEATAKNSELEEQNRDLSFFISGMEKLKDQGEEIKEGTVSVPDPQPPGKKKKKKPGQ